VSVAEVKPLRITAQLKNNRLIRAREAMGYDSAAEAARVLGLSHPLLCEFERLARSPVNRQGDEPRWSKTAMKIAVAYKIIPKYLWPEELEAVTGTVSNLEVDIPVTCLEPTQTPEDKLESAEILATAVQCLDYLSSKEKMVLQCHFGLNGNDEKTLEEIGQSRGLSRQWALDIQKRALKKIQDRMLKLDQFCVCGHVQAVHHTSFKKPPDSVAKLFTVTGKKLPSSEVKLFTGFSCDNCRCENFKGDSRLEPTL